MARRCAGEKLNESTAGDVRQLCTTLLNCYLIQLLESGCALLPHAQQAPSLLPTVKYEVQLSTACGLQLHLSFMRASCGPG